MIKGLIACYLAWSGVMNTADLQAQVVYYSAASIPDELKEGANHVWRLDYTKFSVKSPKDISVHVRQVITILNGNSHEKNQIVYYDKSSKITHLKAKIYDAYGNLLREAKKSDFSDKTAISGGTMYSDSRYKMIELNHNSYPYTIEFEYKKSLNGALFYPSCFIGGYRASVEQLKFIVEMPAGLDLRHKTVNIDLQPEVRQENSKTIYSWTVENQKPLIKEELMPNYTEVAPYIDLSPAVFYYDGYYGDFTSWQSYGHFFYDLNKTQTKLSPLMTEKVRALTKGKASNYEKVEALYRYLQDHTRYVSVQLGIGGFQAFNAEYVEKNQYGDCKALSNFMLSMLESIGIKAYHAIIYRDAYDRYEVDEQFSDVFGNHMIVYLPEEDIWLECTENDYPVNYLGRSNDDRPVMLLTEEGGKLVRSPAFDIQGNRHQGRARIKISEAGSAVIENSIRFSGPKHEIYRYLENNYSEKEQDEWFLEHTGLPAFSIEKLEFSTSGEVPEAQMDYRISVGRYASKAGKRIFLPMNKLNVFDQVPPPDEKRIHPIRVMRNYSESDEFVFELPEGYEIESIPEKEIDLETTYGKYAVRIQVEGTKMIYQRDLEMYKADLAAKEYEAFRNFRKSIAKADGMKVVLVKKKT